MVRHSIAIEISPATRTSVKQYKGKRKKKREQSSESGNIFQQPIQRYFSLAGGQSYRRHVPFIQGGKARIWLKLSPPVFFQLFARKRFTLVFLPYI